MKTITSLSRMIVCTVILFLSFIFSPSVDGQTTQVAVIREWVQHFANQDSIMESPSCKDKDGNFYVAGYTLDANTGPDIVIAKYDKDGNLVWSEQYSGSTGYYRDQATAICVDDSQHVYVCGIQIDSNTTTGFDIVTIRTNGPGDAGNWVSVWSGNYYSGMDVPVAIGVNGGLVYVTGTTQDTTGLLDIVTLQYSTGGTLNWTAQYDYANLYDVPRALKVKDADNKVYVTGGSQNSLLDWDYLTLGYSSTGTPIDTVRITNTGNSFDRANAVALTDSGTVYITGRASNSTFGFVMRTVKIDSTGALVWIRNFDLAGFDNEANAIAVDEHEQIYITGYGKTGAGDETSNYVTLKYDSAGNLLWSRTFNGGANGKDVANYIDVDSLRQVYVTGETSNGTNSDFGTIAYDSQGNVLWQDVWDGNYHGNDRAMHIECDGDGIVYVSGQSQTDTSTYEYVTIQYDTKHFISPPDTDSTGTSLAYYPNYGQIVGTNDSARADIKYYAVNHYPYLYFFKPEADSSYRMMSYVFSRVDTDTTTADTLHRVDLTFELNQEKVVPVSENTKPFSVNKNAGGLMNYYLPQCPDGISVEGFQKLLYPDVFNYTDILFYGNGAGMKYYIIMKPGADYDVGLNFDGQDSITVVGDTVLNIHTSIGTYSYPRPEVYQIDANGNYVALNWQGEYADWGNGRVGFTLGSIDANLTLVIKMFIPEPPPGIPVCNQNNFQWSTYLGTLNGGIVNANASDNAGNVYVCGNTSNGTNTNFPITSLAFQPNLGGLQDCFIARFNPSNSINLFPYNIEWCTYYGLGGRDFATSIGFNNANGNVYIAGQTGGLAYVSNPSSNFNNTSQGGADAFIARMNALNGFVSWSSAIGGSNTDGALGLAINNNASSNDYGDVYVVGYTESPGAGNPGAFTLVTSNAAVNSYNQTQQNGNPYCGFVARFDVTDDWAKWISLFGGSGWENLEGATVLNNDNVIIVGRTSSQNPDIPTNPGIVDATNANNTTTHSLQLCFAGGGEYFQSNHFNSVNVLLVSFTPNDQLIWSTYFGGSGAELPCGANSVATNGSDIFVFGLTNSPPGNPVGSDFPLFPGGNYYQTLFGGPVYDYFIAEFKVSNYTQAWTTYFGGGGGNDGNNLNALSGGPGQGAITTDNNGNIYIAGSTGCSTPSGNTCDEPITQGEFPVCPNNICFAVTPYTCTYGGTTNDPDGFVASFNSAGTMLWGTYLGASNSTVSALCVSSEGGNLWLNFGASLPRTSTLNYQFQLFPSTVVPNIFYNPNTVTLVSPAAPPVVGRFNITSCPVGINETEYVSNEMSLYPNPADNELNVSINLKAASPLMFNIYNNIGQLVFSSNLKGTKGSNKFSISLSEFSEGIYLVQLSAKDLVISKKIIKMK